MTATESARRPAGSKAAAATAAPRKRATVVAVDGTKRQGKATARPKPDRATSDARTSAAPVVYSVREGVDAFVSRVREAGPMALIATERAGVAGRFFKDLSKELDIPASTMFAMLGVPKATVEKRVAADEALTGAGAIAALGMAQLLGIAREIVRNATAPEAKDFDAAKWLGRWLQKPQPALGGQAPAALLDTATGVDVVARLLGALESGAYQ